MFASIQIYLVSEVKVDLQVGHTKFTVQSRKESGIKSHCASIDQTNANTTPNKTEAELSKKVSVACV